MKIFRPANRFFDKKFIFLTLACLAAAFILFGNGLAGTFTLDDYEVIKDREVLSSLGNIPKIFTSPWHPEQWAGTYRPLTMVSLALNNFLFPGHLASFHLVNILLHAFNVVLIFYVVSRFASRRVAGLSALIFMFLPIHTEPVSSIVGRKELLGTFFALWTLLCFFDRRYWLSSLAFLLALLSNEFLISIPLMAVILWWQQTGQVIKSVKIGLTYLIPLPLYFFLRYLALGKYAWGGAAVSPVINPLFFVSLKERVFTSFSYFFLYLKKTFYPINLSPDHSFNQIPVVPNLFASPQALLGLLFILFLTYFFIFSKKEAKTAAVLFLLPYLVMSNLFFVAAGAFAERWWYFPSFGLSVLAALGLDKLAANYAKFKPYIYGLGVIVLVWYSWLTVRQNHIWLNNRNLFVQAADQSPRSAWARSNLAAVYWEEKEFVRAREESAAALEIYDKYPPALNILGKLNWRDKKYEEAEKAFKKALEFDENGRNHRSLYRSLAFLSFDLGYRQDAFQYMEQAVKWPSPRGSQKIIAIDEYLYKTLDKHKDRRANSYTVKEKEELSLLIRQVGGF